MPSSRGRRAFAVAAILLAGIALPRRSSAQQQAQGFGVDRFYPSAPGGGWLVMDALDMSGGLGGAAALTLNVAHDPLRVRNRDGTERLAVVSDEALADFGFAVTYDRWRVYLNLDMPLAVKGQSGTVGAYSFIAPNADLGSNPDTLSDARIGADARLLGSARSPFRLGAGAQLAVPSGYTCYTDSTNVYRCDYVTDGTFRAMGRVLAAGDAGLLTYSGQVGVHLRPRDDSPSPGAPAGSEFIFGLAAGAKWPAGRAWTAVVGPEFFGATALRSFFGPQTTALETLLTGRLEGEPHDGAAFRFKLGGGPGLYQRFGAPEWRIVFTVELLGQAPR